MKKIIYRIRVFILCLTVCLSFSYTCFAHSQKVYASGGVIEIGAWEIWEWICLTLGFHVTGGETKLAEDIYKEFFTDTFDMWYESNHFEDSFPWKNTDEFKSDLITLLNSDVDALNYVISDGVGTFNYLMDLISSYFNDVVVIYDDDFVDTALVGTYMHFDFYYTSTKSNVVSSNYTIDYIECESVVTPCFVNCMKSSTNRLIQMYLVSDKAFKGSAHYLYNGVNKVVTFESNYNSTYDVYYILAGSGMNINVKHVVDGINLNLKMITGTADDYALGIPSLLDDVISVPDVVWPDTDLAVDVVKWPWEMGYEDEKDKPWYGGLAIPRDLTFEQVMEMINEGTLTWEAVMEMLNELLGEYGGVIDVPDIIDPDIDKPIDDPIDDPIDIDTPIPVLPPTDFVTDPNGNFDFLKTKFPFCIPFDMVSMVKNWGKDNEAPTFHFKYKMEWINYTFEINVDMNDYEKYVNIFKDGFFFLFLVGLMLVTGKLIKWV